MSGPLRIGVVGAGLIGQAVHIPTLARMPERFRLTGIADPSQKVREALSSRYPGLRTYADWQGLLEDQPLDALVVCSPHATHAQITLAALDAGLHVFVEKPLTITVEDTEAICKLRATKDLVVQVGYMKRFDAGFESLLESLPPTAKEASPHRLRSAAHSLTWDTFRVKPQVSGSCLVPRARYA